jgi:DNA-binding NtrC family response regulator
MGFLPGILLVLLALFAAPGLCALVRGHSPRAAYARLGLGRGKVLVISPFDPYRELLLDTLRQAGHRPYPAEPRTALTDLRTGRYQIVVSGLVLPFLTGVELLAAVKTACPGTQVVLLTGEPNGVLATDAIRRGAFAVLDKGSMGDLARCVDQALTRARNGTVAAA